MKKYLIGVFLIFITTSFYGQNFNGKVTYKVKRIDIDSTKLKQETPRQKKNYSLVMDTYELIKKLKFQLSFDNENSYFQNTDELIKEGEREFLYRTARLVSKTNSNFYYSLIEKQLIEEKESFGELFLISKSVKINDWMLLTETKKIGNYLCYKAKRTSTVKTKNGDIGIEQTVWYTLEIPLPYGPKDFVGFPGLVLQVFDGKIQYTAKEIVLNPQEEIEINKPTKGKKVTEEEYKVISTESINNTKSIFGIK